MKKSLIFSTLFAIAVSLTGSAYASPVNDNLGLNNPNVVSYYPSGTHTVIQPDNTIEYEQLGGDVVFQAGSNFQQFYEDPNGNRVHTLFRNVGTDTECQVGLFLENPYDPPAPGADTWGYHFPPGDNYCAQSNFQVNNR